MLALKRYGEGRPVVLLHGLTDSSASWGEIVTLLAADRCVITVDLPGHGQSAAAPSYRISDLAEAVAAALHAEHIEAPDLVGHSLGAAVALFAAPMVDAPSLVTVDQRLDLVSLKLQLQPVERLLNDPAECVPLVTALLGRMQAALSPAQVTTIEAARRLDPAVVLGVFDPFLKASVTDLDEQALDAFDTAPAKHLTIFGAPPPDDYVRWFHEVAPVGVIETWDGAGHYLHLVDPSRFVDRLRAFWNS